MSGCDLIIRGGTVAAPGGLIRADVAVENGRIARVAPHIDDAAGDVLEAAGLHLLPAVIDAHVHFNEPGRTEWEGLASGSAALAAGGGCAFFDMPLNSVPPVLDGESFALKRRLAERESRLDFALWGGLVPGNLDRLGELREAGAVGLKAFMCDSGVAEFPAVADRATLRAGMKRAAALGLIVAVHAEDDELARRRAAALRAAGPADVRAWLASRPPELELAAVATALELAGETGCRLHVVHVSTPEGIDLIAAARRRGVDVSAETCPHYLLLSEDDVPRLGAAAKCAPPLRPAAAVEGLWGRLESGAVDTIGSDHSPGPPELKAGADFAAIWGGISGCQHGFPLLVSAAVERWGAGAALPRLAALLAANVADRFGFGGRKGRIAEGFDADLALVDLSAPRPLRNDELLYRHRQGPYEGRACAARVARTLLRGRSIWADGRIASSPASGQFMAPARS